MSHRVLILAGGISHERDVSLKSGRRVADALADAGCEVEVREPDGELIGHLIATRPDARHHLIAPVSHSSLLIA